jgi:hypothetical protein
MKTNTVNNAASKLQSLEILILVLTMALTSCGDNSLEDIFGDSSSSGKNLSSSSSKTKTSSSSSNIVIEDENIIPAASFASEFFACVSFPFIEVDSWFSMSEYWGFSDLYLYIDRFNNDDGEAFKSIFELLYNEREEYLSNGRFKRYIELIAKLIPRRTYVANGWDAMVRQLLIAYEDLMAQPGSFSQVYYIMEVNEANYNNATEAYEQILDFVRDQQLENFILKQDVDTNNYYYWDATEGNVNKSAVVWAYSFWGRRYNENPGSIEPIVDILRMLRDKYPE